MNRGANALVRPAAADVARHRGVNLLVRRLRVLREKCRGGHELSRLAVAALRHLFGDPRVLQALSDVVRGERFDRGDRLPRCSGDRRRAGSHGRAIEMHRACAAQRHTASELGAGHVERITQHPEQRGVGRDINGVTTAVDGEGESTHTTDSGEGRRGPGRRGNATIIHGGEAGGDAVHDLPPTRRPAGRFRESRWCPMRRYRIGGAKFPQAMIVDMLSDAACTFTEYSTDADSGWFRFTWALAVPLLATLSGVYASAVPRVCPMLPHRPTCTSHGWMPPGGAFEIATDTTV